MDADDGGGAQIKPLPSMVETGHAWENGRNSQETQVPSPSQMEAKPSSGLRKTKHRDAPFPNQTPMNDYGRKPPNSNAKGPPIPDSCSPPPITAPQDARKGLPCI